MFSNLLIFATLALAAPGDIYRCTGHDGKSSYQDRPCAGVQSVPFKDEPGGSDPRALREWLDQVRRGATRNGAAASTAGAGATALRADPRPAGTRYEPVSERQLAACSERFYDCADSDGARMDACVARVTACGPGVGSVCCPVQMLACYRSMRGSGAALADAARGALLGTGPGAIDGCN